MHCIQNSCIGRPSPFVEEINDTDSLSQLPEETILKVFGYLSMTELIKCTGVSRRWRRFASDATLWNAFDLRTISPLLKVFDESDWVNHVDLSSFGLNVTDAPPLNKRKTIPALKRCLSSLPIEGNAGITLLTIPKGLTFNTLVKLAGSPKVGNTAKFESIWPRISIIGNTPVDKTYRIVITNNVFEHSQKLSVSDQEALVNKFGCEMPRVLEATVLLVVTFMSSGERLYNDNHPITYTRCSKQVAGYRAVVGGFSPGGVDVYDGRFGDGYFGVGGVLRKF